MTKFNTTVDDREVRHMLAQIRQATADTTPAMRQIGQEISEQVRLTFTDQRDPWKMPWPALNGAFRRGQALLDTGVLRNSINNSANKTSATVGTSNDYASTHQFGATILPRRAKRLSIPLTKEAQRVGGASKFPAPLKQTIALYGGRWSRLLVDAAGTPQYLLARKAEIPARPFMPIRGDRADLPDAWSSRLIQILEDYVQGTFQ